jgi:hypothetical protein
MKERPMLFSTPMVKSILANLKDITRRLNGLERINERPNAWRFEGVNKSGDFIFYDVHAFLTGHDPQDCFHAVKCPYSTGDILWVRETFRYCQPYGCESLNYEYKTGETGCAVNPDIHYKINDYERWRPSIHMPRAACRLNLKILSIRVERLHDITEEDAIREGLSKISKDNGITWKYGIPDNDGLPGIDDHGWPWTEWNVSTKEAFKTLWVKINGQESRDRNPWLFRIEFTKI